MTPTDTAKVAKLRARLHDFMAQHIYPNEKALYEAAQTRADRWQPLELMQTIKCHAREARLRNLFLPETEIGAGLTKGALSCSSAS
jgi:acyl-CoA dehydrogenase